MGLVEDSPQATSTGIGMQCESWWSWYMPKWALLCTGISDHQIIIDTCHSKWWMPSSTHILTRCQLVQRLGYLSQLGDKLAIVLREPKEAPDLDDSGRWGATSCWLPSSHQSPSPEWRQCVSDRWPSCRTACNLTVSVLIWHVLTFKHSL